MLGLIFFLNVPILIGVSAVRSGREEIVFPSIETLRSGEKRLSLRALNQDIELNLKAAGNVLGEGFFIESVHDEKSEIRKVNLEDIKRNLYKDKRTGASLHIEEKERILINGIINNKLRIEPVESGMGRRDKANPHRLYEITNDNNGHVIDEIFPTDFHPVFDESLEELRSGEPIYVEMCIITDTAFSHSFPNNTELLKYLCVLINAAQCRYDNIEINRVELILSGLKINKHISEEPYIHNHIVQGYVIITDAIQAFSVHVGKAGYSCDITVLLSKRKMALLENGIPNSGIDGMAYVGTACDRQYLPTLTYSVGIVYDMANCYEGASLFAHEIAHLLSCPHDGDGSVSYLPNHPGSSECPWNDGFIMSYEDSTRNRYYFSWCCQKNILYLANRVSCLRRNDTLYNLKLSNQRPGEYMESSLGLSFYNYAKHKVFYYDDRCEKLNKQYKLHPSPIFSFEYPDGSCDFACRTKENEKGIYTYWVLRCIDGDMCDVGKRCSNGICL